MYKGFSNVCCKCNQQEGTARKVWTLVVYNLYNNIEDF